MTDAGPAAMTTLDTTDPRALAAAVAAHIRAHPDQHNQQVWIKETHCGTAACAAGWTVLLAGYQPAPRVWEPLGFISQCRLGHGDIEMVSAAAQRLLGLSGADADTLFGAADHEVLPMLDNLAGGLPLLSEW